MSKYVGTLLAELSSLCENHLERLQKEGADAEAKVNKLFYSGYSENEIHFIEQTLNDLIENLKTK